MVVQATEQKHTDQGFVTGRVSGMGIKPVQRRTYSYFAANNMT